MKRWFFLMVLLALVAGWVNTGAAKSDILDKILKQTLPQPGNEGTPQPADSGVGSAYIKLTTGETIPVQIDTGSLNDVQFEGTMRVEQPDGVYYINSAQVAYIRVPAQK